MTAAVQNEAALQGVCIPAVRSLPGARTWLLPFHTDVERVAGGVDDVHGAGVGKAGAWLPVDGHQFVVFPQAPPAGFASLADLEEGKQREAGREGRK